MSPVRIGSPPPVLLKIRKRGFQGEKNVFSLKAGSILAEGKEILKGWAGVYWQYPANNWGEKKGHNLKGYSKFTFWARGEKGAELISFKIEGGITGKYSDSIIRELGKIKLSSEWREYVIDIYGKDLSNLIGGFCWAADSKDNPKGCTFYLDDIVYE